MRKATCCSSLELCFSCHIVHLLTLVRAGAHQRLCALSFCVCPTACIAGPDRPDGARKEIARTGRLFLRNLPYQATEADLTELFHEFGELSEVHLVMDRSASSARTYFACLELGLLWTHICLLGVEQ